MTARPLYLAGQWRTSQPTVKVVNPARGETIGEVCTVPRAAVAQAIADAHAAFPAWRALTAKARGDYLRKIADEVERRGADIARTITLENGKPLAQSQGEVAMTV